MANSDLLTSQNNDLPHAISVAADLIAERDRLKELCGELLMALKGVRCMTNEHPCGCIQCTDTRERVVAAIAKAEGK